MGLSSWTSAGFKGQQAPSHTQSRESGRVPNASQWSQHRSGTRFQNSGRSAKTRSVTPLSPPRPLRDKQETRAEELLMQRLQVHRLASAGKYMIDVFGGSCFLAKTKNHWGLCGYVVDTKFGPRYDVTQLIVLSSIRQDVLAGKVCTTTHFVLSQSYYRQCCHRKLASSCSRLA